MYSSALIHTMEAICKRGVEMELIELLTDQLGINQSQAQGGAGLLLKLAKDKLDIADFSQISQYIPSADHLVEKAPKCGTMGLASGDLAGLAVGFSKLSLASDMVGKFVRIIVSASPEERRDDIKGLIFKMLT